MDEKVIVAYRWDVLAEIKGRIVELPVPICLLFETFSDERYVRHSVPRET